MEVFDGPLYSPHAESAGAIAVSMERPVNSAAPCLLVRFGGNQTKENIRALSLLLMVLVASPC